MKHSESLIKIAPALVKAQAAIRNATKDSNNPHFGNSFASLNSVIDATKGVLNDHGISVIQAPGYGEVCTLSTMLLHESGEWICMEAGSPVSKKDPQGIGSAITYLRRYSLAAITCIGQEDDDGNEAAKPDPREQALQLARDEVTDLAKRHKAKLPEEILAAARDAVRGKSTKELDEAKAAICDHLAKQEAA